MNPTLAGLIPHDLLGVPWSEALMLLAAGVVVGYLVTRS